MMEIVPANLNHRVIIREIATQSWKVAYKNILSEEQSAYMLEMMYSDEVLLNQISNLQHHFLLGKDENNVFQGFVSFEFLPNGKTKIHKLYVLPQKQKSGIGKLLINEVIQESRKHNNTILTLNVNRNNSALSFYKKMDFYIADEKDIDIGNDFLMEDYILEKRI